MISPTPKVLTEADLAGLPRAVSLPPLPKQKTKTVIVGGYAVEVSGYTAEHLTAYAAEYCAAVVSERDALAGRVAELEAALWGCIAAIERTHHCTEADRLAAADKARAAISAKKGG